MRNELGLRVDFPCSGGSGTSNDSNTSRKAFRNCDQFAEITGLDKDLLEDMKTLLITLNSQYSINKGRLKEFCFSLFKKYIVAEDVASGEGLLGSRG